MKSEIIEILKRPFGKELIKHREGRDGKKLDYIEVQNYVDRLNEAFAYEWSFELTRREIIGEQIVVEVKLTAAGLIKTGLGGATITRSEDNKTVVALADDFKMGEADGLKRACRLLGIGAELYASEQENASGLISSPPPSTGTQHRAGPHSLPPSPLPPRERLTAAQLQGIKDRVKKQGLDPSAVRRQIKTTYGVEVEYLTRKQASHVITGLDANRPSGGKSGQQALAG
jgi:hypothetical protein